MSAARDSIRTGARFAGLLAFGLALGFGWHLLQRPKGLAADAPWSGDARHAVGDVGTADAAGSDAKASALRPFALRGTIIATDPLRSAAIFDLGKGQIHTLRPGADLPGVGRLLEVADKQVILEVNGRRQTFGFNDSTLAPGEVLVPIQALARQIIANEAAGAVFQEAAAPGGRTFVVPATAPRYSDAPRDEPELNATPRPGQSIDTTVWN